MTDLLLNNYQLRRGSGKDKALLVKFMQLTYQELFLEQQDFSHLAVTVERYFSQETPLWLVEFLGNEKQETPSISNEQGGLIRKVSAVRGIACLWLGNAVDQVQGDRFSHIFLLYVSPAHRLQGIGSALMRHAEDWAKSRGDRQIGLQVFEINTPAVNLYRQLGYQTQSLWMVKPLSK